MVFVFVLAAQLWLVAVAGTDIPFQDQWDVEGRWLYPTWLTGDFHMIDLLRPGNENRMVWTLLMDLFLFDLNQQWDPLVQLAVGAGLRAACAGGLACILSAGLSGRTRWLVVAVVTVAFLPHLPWHNALWAIESHSYFVLGFSMLTFALLAPAERSLKRTWAGVLTGVAALLAMSPAALVPGALLGLVVLRRVEARQCDWSFVRQAWPGVVLLGLAVLFRVQVSQHDLLHAVSWRQFMIAAGRVMAWPHVGQPIAAMVMNLPIFWAVLGRAAGRRKPVVGEDCVLLIGFWGVLVALAAAWARGNSPELSVGVPSRYVDFIVLMPLVNAWLAVILLRDVRPHWRKRGQMLAGVWGIFLFVGWLGLSGEVMRGIVLPRMRDREAPVRLMREFQRTDDTAVYAGQPRLLVPHPNLDSVRAVLRDPRMAGALPPSMQPEQPMGPLSRATRRLLGR